MLEGVLVRLRPRRAVWLMAALLLSVAISWSSSAMADGEVLTIALDGPQTSTPAGRPHEALQLSPPAVSQPTASERTTTRTPAQPQQPEAPKVGQIGVISSAYANIYRNRVRSNRIYSAAKKGTPVAIVSHQGGWYGILMANGWTGWLESKHVKLTDYLLVADQSRGDYASRGGYGRAGALISTAMAYSGVPYIMGGNNPNRGIDCSAFLQQVFARNGVSLPRTARTQARVGSPVPLDQIQPGDRLYFSCKNSYIDHCGMYIGGGQFIHCSASKGGVAIDSLTRDYYWQNLITVRRS